uniref:non-specific protein-tyrosine kinase n=1 Tax=Cyanothece sp. (strain PCC 7425 / ATCC 29141) TaxID=395961 RepID=B8HTN4_CYAP4
MQALEDDRIDLGKYLTILKRRWLGGAIAFGSILSLVIAYTLLQKPVYQAQGLLLLKDSENPLASMGATSVGNLVALGGKSSPIDTEAQIIRSTPIIQELITTLQLKDPQGQLLKPEAFLESLSVNNIRGTDLLQVSYRSTDPKQAVAIVDLLIKIYKRNNILANRLETTNSREFIERKLPDVTEQLRGLDRQIRSFKETHGIVDLPTEQIESVKFKSLLARDLAQAKSLLATAQARATGLSQQVGMSIDLARFSNAVSQSKGVQVVLDQYQQVEAELAVARTELQPDHPKIKTLEEQLTELNTILRERVRDVAQASRKGGSLPTSNLQTGASEQQLVDNFINAEVERLALSSQVTSLSRTEQTYQQRMNALPKLEQWLGELERRRVVAQTIYEGLLKTLQSLQISEQQNAGNVRLIQAATLSDEPVSPKLLLNLILGTILGSLGAIVVIFILESKDKTLKSLEEIQQYFDYVTLAMIPFDKAAATANKAFKPTQGLERATPQLYLRDQPNSHLSEAYRTLQANLKFLSSPDHPIRTIVITSTRPQEGKSTVSANLALAIAELGHKVLLIDADLRLPLQHQIWELPNATGLTHLLADNHSSTKFIHQESDNLDVLTAGPRAPNPLLLLDSQHMASLIDKFRTVYDYVLIDTPPIGVAVDALVVSKVADGILVVVRPDVTDSNTANAAREALVKSNQRVLGLAVNGVTRSDGSYHYYDGYYSSDNDTTANGKTRSEKLGMERL